MSTERSAASLLAFLRRLWTAPSFPVWGVTVVPIAFGWWVRAQFPPVALADSDTWGWLHPALQWVGGAGFHEEYEREWLYGAFLAFGLKVTGGFDGVIRIQQALGVAAQVLLWLSCFAWISLLPGKFPVRTIEATDRPLEFAMGYMVKCVGLLMGLALAVTYPINFSNLVFELSLRPEAILSFVVFGQLFCLLSYIRYRWKEPCAAKSITFGALAILLAAAAYGLKPNWALALLATSLPVFLGAAGKALPAFVRFGTPLLGIALVFALLWVPEKALFLRNGKTRVVLPMTFFTIHADVITESFASQLRSGNVTPERGAFLEGFLPDLQKEMETARREIITYPTYKRLGFDPDYLMYRSTLFPILEARYHMTKPQIVAFCYESYLLAWKENPLGMIRKIFTQMGYFFPPDPNTFIRKRIKLSELYAGTLASLPQDPGSKLNAETRAAYQALRDAVKKQAEKPRELTADRKSVKLANRLSAWALPLEILFAVLLLASLFWRPLAEYRLAGLAALALFSAPLGNALTIAIVHALDNSRYRMSYSSFLLLAFTAMAVFSLAVLLRLGIMLYKSRRLPKTPEA